jgi:hypothetical protein
VDRAALVAYIVAITRLGIREWTDRWKSLADWLVAAGTIGLALATFALALSARRAARESSQAARDARDALAASLKPQVHLTLGQFGAPGAVEARVVVVAPLSPMGLTGALPATDVQIHFNCTSGRQGSASTPTLEPNGSKLAQDPPYLNVMIEERSDEWPPADGDHVTATVTFSDARGVGTYQQSITEDLFPSDAGMVSFRNEKRGAETRLKP